MRTTLTLEPDVARQLKSRMAEQEVSLKELVNDALRRGLSATPASRPKKPFRVASHSFGFKPGIDMSKLNQLLDELEVQEFAAKMQGRKKPR